MPTMTRFRYPLAIIILLAWVAAFFFQYVPHLKNWSLYTGVGCVLTAIFFTLSALIRKKWNAFAVFSLLLSVLIGSWLAKFTYRLNNVCDPGDHIIQSDADAIKQAQIRIIRARYGSHGIPGYTDEKPGYADFSRANSCSVTRI